MKYIVGKVYSLEVTHKSFSWNNGLFICLKTDENTVWGCKLNKQGKPGKFDDGRYTSFCIGINNSEIKETNLIYDLGKDFKYD